MTHEALYRRHLETLDSHLQDALERAGKKGLRLRGVLLHAGRSAAYHRDDREIPFWPSAHFARYVPLTGPEHCVLALPGRQPLVVRVAPRDYWYEAQAPAASYWQSAVELHELASLADAKRVLGSLEGIAYLGSSPEAAGELGVPPALCEPEALMIPLDWHRGVKTDHEIALLEVASERAARGHAAARDAFLGGATEREIHFAYLGATGLLERELPYENIVAFDEKSATLHYQNKRGKEAPARHTFLLDAGGTCDGYASDITRTWAKPGADPVYTKLLEGLDAVERDLVAMVTPGRPYLEIHLEAHRRTARLLAECGIVRGSAEEAFDRGVTRTFLPHGIGHHLGLQTHDVGGHLASPDGGSLPPPPEHRFLRNTRTLAPGHVVTIEPGVYFIPMLLEALRATSAASLLDWRLVERLTPFGGARIEDDVLCTKDGARDLTRPLVAGPRGR